MYLYASSDTYHPFSFSSSSTADTTQLDWLSPLLIPDTVTLCEAKRDKHDTGKDPLLASSHFALSPRRRSEMVWKARFAARREFPVYWFPIFYFSILFDGGTLHAAIGFCRGFCIF